MAHPVLLPTDQVELYPPDSEDGHGWAFPADGILPWWSGAGNLQLVPADTDPRAADRGGGGPYDPGGYEQGTLYLPPDAEPVEGSAALIRGRGWVLSGVRLVVDPTGGPCGCWTATVTGTDRWPGG